MQNKKIIEAVIFDFDGVIAKTHKIHELAWHQTFNDFFKSIQNVDNVDNTTKLTRSEYTNFIEGKIRYQAVTDILNKRKIKLDYGDIADTPGYKTACGIANKKNDIFNKLIEEMGVEFYDSTLSLIRELKDNNIQVGVASSSKNCENILAVHGLLGLFDTIIDGNDAIRNKLRSKPNPDIFNKAIENLRCDKLKTVIIEDSYVGLEAAVKAHAGCIIGITRNDNRDEIEMSGADIIVECLSEISYDKLINWFSNESETSLWSLKYNDYNKDKEKVREVLMAQGNGYFVTRANIEECDNSNINYPATYMNGVYNILTSEIADEKVENDDLVNCPNWTSFKFKCEDDTDFIDINECKIISINRNLNFKNGELIRDMIIEDSKGRKFNIKSKRIISMHDYHIAALRYTLSAINYKGKIYVKTGINGDIYNDNIERYKALNNRHLTSYYTDVNQNNNYDYITLECKTNNSDILINQTLKIITDINTNQINKEDKCAYIEYVADAEKTDIISVTKILSIYNSLYDNNIREKAANSVDKYNSYQQVKEETTVAWQAIWDQIDLIIEGDRRVQKILRLHLYHLMISFSPHNKHFDAGLTARGLHGESCRGHVYWDEIFIFPFYCLHYPDVAKSALMYRYNRLNSAKQTSKKLGYKGALYPYQSSMSGYEASSKIHLNPLSGRWIPNNSDLQRHVSLAIAHNIYTYYHFTEDKDFLYNYGLEMYWEICRFWASLVRYNKITKRYSIYGVMGPDEFHEKHEKSDNNGLKDNAYTNIMTSWILHIGANLFENFSDEAQKVVKALDITEKETKRWRDIANSMTIIIEDEIISQFDGFLELKELDFEAYKKKYGDIKRLDRILKSEDLSPDEYKICKQADTLMLFYILQDTEVTALLRSMGYNIHERYIKKNLEYYLKRTSHGSSLSKITHAHLASIINDFELSEELYYEALTSDMFNKQGTTSEGIHTGVMAGTIITAIFTFAGVNLHRRDPEFSQPKKPEHWGKVSGKFKFRGRTLKF